MAKILFGGPQEKERDQPSTTHDELVSRLKALGHEVEYFTRGDDMFGRLMLSKTTAFSLDQDHNYQLILYDTGLFFDQAQLYRKAELFKSTVVKYLQIPKAPVIVLAEKEMSDLVREEVKKANFKQVDQPYRLEEVLREIDSILGKQS